MPSEAKKTGKMAMIYKFYEELTIDEKINAKSWGFWRLPNRGGYMLTMIDNAKSFETENGTISKADFTKRRQVAAYEFEMPRRGNGSVMINFAKSR